MSNFFDKFNEAKKEAEEEGEDKVNQMKNSLKGKQSEESKAKYWKSRQNSKKMEILSKEKHIQNDKTQKEPENDADE